MKLILFTSIFLLKMFEGHAQNTITFSAGPSFPVGDFAKKNINNSSSGFAKIGEQINFSFAPKLNKTFSISSMLYGQMNPVNTASLEKQFSQNKFYYGAYSFDSVYNPNPPPSSGQYTIYSNWKFDKHSWIYAGFILGVEAEIPLNRKIYFTTKVMAGIVYATSPKLNGKSLTNTASAQIMQNSKSAFGFSYLISSGLKFSINKKLYFVAGINYTGTNQLKFKNVKETFSGTTSTNSGPSVFSFSHTGTAMQKIDVIGFNLGVSLEL